MDWSRTPLVECFERGDVPRDVRLMAARGGLALRVPDQLTLLIVLVSDPDPVVAKRAERTIARLPPDSLAAFLANPDVPEQVRSFFATRPAPAEDATTVDEPTDGDDGGEDAETEAETESAGDREEVVGAAAPPAVTDAATAAADTSVAHVGAARRLSRLNVAGRIKAAIQGSREERAILIRDPNRVVSAAVLSSPKLTEGDIESIARMTSVSDEVLRQIGTNRSWMKNYAVMAALARNAKTPIGLALTLIPRLNERDVKILGTDRNIPEPVRVAARKLTVRHASRRQ